MINRNHWELPMRVTNTVEDLWKNAVEYFKWCESNPLRAKRTVTQGKEIGRKVEIEKIRPYSLKALCLHCGVTEEYIKDLMNSPKDSTAYLVVGRILTNIYVQIYELGMIGEISPVMAAKVLNMEDQDNGPQKVTIEYIGDLPKLAKTENEILEQIQIENGEIEIPREQSGENQ
jgi:hypothetical protein